MNFRYGKWLLLTLLVLILDQYSKHLALTHLYEGEIVAVMPHFNWTLRFNPGAAFSFLADAGGWQRWFFVILNSGITVGLLIWLFRLPAQQRLLPFALPLIIGGAIGNIIDRVRYGHVVDFIDWYAAGYHWPAFNLADSAVFLGAALVILDSFRQPSAEKKPGTSS